MTTFTSTLQTHQKRRSRAAETATTNGGVNQAGKQYLPCHGPILFLLCSRSHRIPVSGGDSEGATPVPIPNTEVKPLSADGTARFPGGRVGRRRIYLKPPLAAERGFLLWPSLSLTTTAPSPETSTTLVNASSLTGHPRDQDSPRDKGRSLLSSYRPGGRLVTFFLAVLSDLRSRRQDRKSQGACQPGVCGNEPDGGVGTEAWVESPGGGGRGAGKRRARPFPGEGGGGGASRTCGTTPTGAGIRRRRESGRLSRAALAGFRLVGGVSGNQIHQAGPSGPA